MEFIDYYKTLSVSESADTATIKKSYRKLARKYHPDVSKETNAEEMFKRVAEAWNVLKDKKKRSEYDLERKTHLQGHQPGRAQGHSGSTARSSNHAPFHDESLHDIFSAFYSNQAYGSQARHSEETFSVNGQDTIATIKVSLEDAYQGSTLPIKLQMPVHHDDGSIQTEIKELKVTLPRGITNGQKIRLKEQGGPPLGTGKRGDLIIEVQVATHEHFLLDGRDVTLNLPVSPWEAALGASIEVKTLGGNVTLRIPANAKQGQTLRLKGRGLPGKPDGDQFVVFSVIFPEATTDDQKSFYQNMKTVWPDFNPRKIKRN